MRRFGLITGQARRPDSITDYLAILRSRWGVLVAVPLLAMIAAGLIGLTTTPRYSATAVIYFAPPPAEAPNGLLPNLHYAQDIVGSHALVATESRILAPVITRLGLATTPEDLAHDVSASARTDTLIVEVEARALTGRGAAALADAVAREISQSVAALNPRVTGNYSPLRVYSVAAAEVPLQPSIPRTGLNLMVALVLGTLGGMILCIAIEHFAPRVRSPRDLQRAVSVPVMGWLPRQVTARTRRLGRRRRPFSDRATGQTTDPAAGQAMSDVYSGLRVIFQDNDFQVIAFVTREERARVLSDEKMPAAAKTAYLKRLDGIAKILAQTGARDTSLLALLGEDSQLSELGQVQRRELLEAAGIEEAPAPVVEREEPSGQVVPQSVLARQLANPFMPPDIEAARRQVEVRAQRLAGWELLGPLLRSFEQSTDGAASCMPLPDPDDAPVAPELHLMKHQAQVVAAAAQGHRTFLLADEPGLGKTAQALLSAQVATAYPLLVVVPNVVKMNWAREVNLWTPARLSGRNTRDP